MKETLTKHLNQCDESEALDSLRQCCGSQWWCERVAAARPFADRAAFDEVVAKVFADMPREAWLEAFASHPRIGDLESLSMKLAGNRQWSRGEQAGVLPADEKVIEQIRDGNEAYFRRFGFTFIVCATGKSANEMFAILTRRLKNDAETELSEAAAAQREITQLRIAKLAARLMETNE